VTLPPEGFVEGMLWRSTEFWKLIVESRKRPTVRLRDVEHELFPETEAASQ
jgi:hypothetical protein